jgi:WD40 repeat protein
MDSPDSKHALDILDGAHGLSKEELESYLDLVCGENSLLRREVLGYLDYDVEHTVISVGTDGDSEFELPAATVSATRYELGEEIASGGVGVILWAYDTNIRRRVAIKVLREKWENDPDVIRRFVQEAQIAGQLQHPGIAPVYEIGRLPDRRPFIAMKLVKGATLEELLARRPDPAEDQAKFLGIFKQVSQAIAFAHQRGVVHRDLKPSNVMVGEFGEVQVMDWGIAKLLDDKRREPLENEDPNHADTSDLEPEEVETDASGHSTKIGDVLGTPAYMAPEQCIGRADTTADVFSLGAILFEILTGQKTPRSLDAVGKQLDPCHGSDELAELVWTCLQTKEVDRPPNAGAVAERISAHLNAIQARLKEAEIASARAEVKAEEERKLWRRNLLIIAAFALLLMIAAIGGPIIALREAGLRLQADDQRDIAVAAGEQEARAKALAEQRAEENRRTLYFDEMNLASLTTLDSTGLRTVRDLTNKWIPKQGEADLRGWEWHYLDGLYGYDLFSYEGHQAEVTAVEFSPDGSRGASLDRPGTLCLWMATDGTNSSTWKAKARQGSSLAWNPSGDELAFFDPGQHLVRMRGDSGEVVMRTPWTDGKLRWLVWSPDGKRLATQRWTSHELLIVDVGTGELEQSIPTDFAKLGSLCWSPDGSQIAAGNAAGQFKIWSIETGSPVSRPRPAKLMRHLSWSPDGKYLAGESSGPPAFSIAVLDAGTLEEVDRFVGHFDFVTSVQWSKDSRKVISGGLDRTVRIWELGKYDERLVIPCTENPASFSWNAATAQVAITEGKRVRVVDGKRDAVPSLAVTPSSIGTIDEVRWNPDGSRLLFTCQDGTVRLWNPDNNSSKREFSVGTGKGPHSACWSPDGTRFAFASKDIVICTVAEGAELIRLDGHRGNVFSVDWSPGGKRLASCGEDGAIRVWDAETGDELGAISPEGASFNNRSDVRWSPDEEGGKLAVSAEAKVYVLDSRSHSIIRTIESRGGSPINVLSWDPTGRRIATGSTSGAIEIFDGHSGEVVQTLRGHEGGTRGLQWNPDGTRLASTGGDRLIRVWHLEMGLVALTIQASRFPVVHLAWSPDGRRLASTDTPWKLKIWDAGDQSGKSSRR